MTTSAMDELISVVNELHDAFTDLKMDVKIDLPQIAVIGSQSSGKSSVLESVVGRDFLPRGSGIVTKCPLVLQLVQQPKGSTEWGEFLHNPGKKYTDFEKIRDEIERRTDEMTQGMRGHVTKNPINLKIYSPNVLTLTLVDLPGLVMNAVADQPQDIEAQIEQMVTEYVRPSNTIMLAVSPANADIATSSALRLAKKLDPEGERTLGVLTKLDLMDRGTDAMDMLEGKFIPLRLGFIGVVNRSQADINTKKSTAAARAAEKEFFSSHPVYSKIADKQGTEYLSKQLNKLLLAHIQNSIPELKEHVDRLSKSMVKTQESLGMLDECQMDHGAHLLNLIKSFSDNIRQCIEGEAIEGARELVGGARIDYIFHECFTPYVTSIKAGKDLTDEYIRLTIRNRSGMQSTLFPSDQVFITLSKQQIRRLEEPCVKCVSFIFDELLKIIEMCSIKADRFPALKKRFVEIARDLLTKYRGPAIAHVRTTINAEAGYINIKHPAMQDASFRILNPHLVQNNNQPEGAAAAPHPQAPNQANTQSRSSRMSDVPKNIQLGANMSERESLQNSQIREMVEAYFSICQRNVCDQIPKIISLLMINQLVTDLYPKLIQELYKEELYATLLSESADVATKRKATTNMMKCLKIAQGALSKVRDIV